MKQVKDRTVAGALKRSLDSRSVKPPKTHPWRQGKAQTYEERQENHDICTECTTDYIADLGKRAEIIISDPEGFRHTAIVFARYPAACELYRKTIQGEADADVAPSCHFLLARADLGVLCILYTKYREFLANKKKNEIVIH
jgi:hypothetical protein